MPPLLSLRYRHMPKIRFTLLLLRGFGVAYAADYADAIYAAIDVADITRCCASSQYGTSYAAAATIFFTLILPGQPWFQFDIAAAAAFAY